MAKEYIGFGGWLIVWCVYMLFYLGLFLLYSIIGLDILSFIVFIGIAWLTYLFFKKKKIFLIISYYFLGLQFIYSFSNSIGNLVPVITSSGNSKFVYLGGFLGSFLPVITTILWMIYFKKSKRAKNTFIN